MQQVARDAAAGKVKAEEIDEKYISDHLETHFMTDPDLLIRTGGELRISNYLLWQAAYAEFWFTKTNWPDFPPEASIRYWIKGIRSGASCISSMINGSWCFSKKA